MDTSGKPSREQLEQHYKNSRKYFDDMAEHYKESDPEYYNSMIVPIIRRNRYSDAAGYNPNSKRAMAITITSAVVVLGMAMGIFFLIAPEAEQQNPVDKMLEKVEDEPSKTNAPLREINPGKTKDPSLNENIKADENMTDYEKGVFYYDQGGYDMALQYFGKVKPGTDNYDAAQKYISEISTMSDDEKLGRPSSDDAPKVNPFK